MTEIQNSKRYDLEKRTLEFARRVHGKQVIRSSGSIGANYIEANEALSKKDFQMRIKICRKEAKETEYWLRLLDNGNDTDLENEKSELIREAIELRKIFGSIVEKSK